MTAAKDLITRGRRRIAAPLLCCFCALLLILGSVASLRAIKPILSDELFPTRTEKFSGSSLPSSYNLPSCNGCIPCTNTSSSTGSCGEDQGEVWHSMDDEELMWRASMVPGDERASRVAFMFLTRGRMPLRLLWERFFEGQQGQFSVYLHASPEFKEEPPKGSVFFRRRIPSKVVEWGRPTMIDAERRLLANALLDPSNVWFLLLSESCIPLFNLTFVRNYLTNSPLSFLGAFDDPRTAGRGRYNRRMHPLVSLQDWRKGSQWFAIQRHLAVEIISDGRYYPVFRELCRPPCYMDEHYLPTFVSKLFPAANSNRSFTWVDWSRGGSHPATYRRRDVAESLIDRMRRGSSKCVYNGSVSSTCFLFARKFDSSTLQALLRISARVLGF